MAYYTALQVAVAKDEPLSRGGEIVVRLNRDGVKKFCGTTKNYDKSRNEIQIRCTVDGTTYGYNIRLEGTVSDDITMKDGGSTIEVRMRKTSDFSIAL